MCGDKISPLTLCKKIINHVEKIRCRYVVCESCKYCHCCKDRLNFLKLKLKENRYGKEKPSEICKFYVKAINEEYDKNY